MRSHASQSELTRTIVLEMHDESTDRPPRDVDPEFVVFLHDRLCEEILAATQRRLTTPPDEAEVAERGLRLLDELVLDIKHGRDVDPTSLRLLALAYQKHPEFRADWNTVSRQLS